MAYLGRRLGCSLRRRRRGLARRDHADAARRVLPVAGAQPGLARPAQPAGRARRPLRLGLGAPHTRPDAFAKRPAAVVRWAARRVATAVRTAPPAALANDPA